MSKNGGNNGNGGSRSSNGNRSNTPDQQRSAIESCLRKLLSSKPSPSIRAPPGGQGL